MATRELFEFITDPTINAANIDAYLDKVPRQGSMSSSLSLTSSSSDDQVMAVVEQRLEHGMTAEEEVAEEVFKRSFIPRTLDDVGIL